MLSQPEVNAWLEEFLEAYAAPVDFARLKGIMSKRLSVEMPNEPKIKKFEDFEKKHKDILSAWKGAKRVVPKGAPVISCAAKKDEVDVISPQQVNFVWTKELCEVWPNVNLGPGEKAKVQMYDRFKLSSKKECSNYAPVFSPADFKGQDRKDDEDGWGWKLIKALQAGTVAEMIDDAAVFSTPGGKQTKDDFLAAEKKLEGLSYASIGSLQPVITMPDKDGVCEAIIPLARTFKWADGMTEAYPGNDFTAGAEVRMVSYEELTVKAGMVTKIRSHMDAATCIKPAGKSGGN
mmetsp:Transcript_13161/g.33141  ORF Transcript_13161/g.33141 Transcript_13161/m.33141 type:complete len:291 (+) Transcript_13161:132-1004(+)|eukprot:CAMPEP_0173434120 /NCGR_PEP_ID=MMETSP1357-20121228/12023_1 /TAXON_ID=77926 /ORGANISM="Hemiselmis rufescens, Strain PCC563" /LENGTH=290 /DNA_ID=CAMNT_0014398931 /DNA_START=118 /DNA_END=990 /DNA_ORIENTATION=-